MQAVSEHFAGTVPDGRAVEAVLPDGVQELLRKSLTGEQGSACL